MNSLLMIFRFKIWVFLPCVAILAAYGSSAVAQSHIATDQDVHAMQKLVDRLNSADPIDSERAEVAIEEVGDFCEPILRDQAKRADLTPTAKTALEKAIARLEPRLQWKSKRKARDEIVITAMEQEVLADAKRHVKTAPWLEALQKSLDLDGKKSHAGTLAQEREFRSQEVQQMEAAVNAGCDEPAFLALYGLVLNDSAGSREKINALFLKARKSSSEMDVAPYMSFVINRRVILGMIAGKEAGLVIRTPEATPILNDMGHALCKVLDDPAIPTQMKIKGCNALYDIIGETQLGYKRLYDHIFIELEKQLPNDSQALAFKGKCWTNIAWEARGGGVAGTVTPQGWKDFFAGLDTAADALEKSYTLDPQDPAAATQMITVLMGRQGGRGLMETWFKRAMDANPDDNDACQAKMLFLEPKWSGDAKAMLEFGHESFDAGNWTTPSIPLLLVNAHQRLAKYQHDANDYFTRPGVWDDIRISYSKALEIFPNDTGMRSIYCRLACLCEQWKEADAQFKILGNKISLHAFTNEQELESFRTAAADGAGNP